MYLCYKQSWKESYCSLVCKLYLPCFFSVVDLCVSGISARCNQATVAFLRLLIFALFFSITEVASNREKILFFNCCFLPPMPAYWGWQLLRRMRQEITDSWATSLAKLSIQRALMKIITQRLKMRPRENITGITGSVKSGLWRRKLMWWPCVPSRSPWGSNWTGLDVISPQLQFRQPAFIWSCAG